MKIGTLSFLFGVHNPIFHTKYVYKAWKSLYGKPTFKEFICILIHDIGYLGCGALDGTEDHNHPELGGKLAGKLFGEEYRLLCLGHSRHYCKTSGITPSKLCFADKLSIQYENKKWYLLRAKLTGELKWYRKESRDVFPNEKSDEDWFDWVCSLFTKIGSTKNVEALPYTH